MFIYFIIFLTRIRNRILRFIKAYCPFKYSRIKIIFVILSIVTNNEV